MTSKHQPIANPGFSSGRVITISFVHNFHHIQISIRCLQTECYFTTFIITCSLPSSIQQLITATMNILEIEIQTDDLKETDFFYSDILGLQLVNKEHNSISFLAGKSTLTFVKSNRLNPKYHFAFNIPNNKLDEAIIWVMPKLTLIETPGPGIIANFEAWNARAIYFYDNNKNIIEFIARFDLENSTDKPFDISSIQSISEIGIVTDTPLKLADKLVRDNNIDFFSKGPKSENFVAIGDDNGLFIVAETNRKWYPTDQQAEKHFTRVKITSYGFVNEITINDENACSQQKQ